MVPEKEALAERVSSLREKMTKPQQHIRTAGGQPAVGGLGYETFSHPAWNKKIESGGTVGRFSEKA